MTLEQQLQLSYYREIADLYAEHGIYLVQDVRSRQIYVKKQLAVYNADIYRYLQAHPIANTPRILFVEEEQRMLTVIEEYIHGDTLETLLKKDGPFSEKRVISIALQLCRILSDFHSCNPAIVNRDIKPSNIKVTPDGVVKLLDLNAAKWCSEDAQKDTVLLGTQGYAAPEQYGFGASNIQTDIYAVGVLMNELLTGQLPGYIQPGGLIGRIIRKCVELSPSGRYQSMRELIRALETLQAKYTLNPKAIHWREYLLPGFRGRNVIVWLFSALGYLFLLFGCFGLQVENAGPVELLLNRITCAFCFFGCILFTGNYRDVHRQFFMTRSKSKFLRWVGITIVDIAIFMVGILTLQIIVDLFLR